MKRGTTTTTTTNRTISNRAHGQSVVELLIATVMFASVATVLLSLYSMNTMQLSQFWNKSDVLTSSTDALARLGQLTRTARGFGENYGTQPVQASTQSFHNNFNVATKSSPLSINVAANTAGILAGNQNTYQYFPAAGDPYYGTGACPPTVYGSNWPFTQGAPIAAQMGPPSGPPPPGGIAQYCLAQDTYIVQVPVFVGVAPGAPAGTAAVDPSQGLSSYSYIWPAQWDNASPTAGHSMLAVDTYVFRVMPDATNPGTSVMMEAAFPACPAGVANPVPADPTPLFAGHPTNVTISQAVPIVLCKGIVGPLDANNNISTFAYVEKVGNTSTVNPPGIFNGVQLYTSDYTGLICNLEMLKNEQGMKASVASFRSEYYVRNNALTDFEGEVSN